MPGEKTKYGKRGKVYGEEVKQGWMNELVC